MSSDFNFASSVRLSSLLDHRKANKLASKIVRAVDEFCVSHDLPTSEDAANGSTSSSGGRKRKGDDPAVSDSTEAKTAKTEGAGSAPEMTPDMIRQMMANTMKEIAARKAQLTSVQESNKVRSTASSGSNL